MRVPTDEAFEAQPTPGLRALVEAFLWAGPTLVRLRDEHEILCVAVDVIHWQGLDARVACASDGQVIAARGRPIHEGDEDVQHISIVAEARPHANLSVRVRDARAAYALQLLAAQLGALIENARQHRRPSSDRIARERFTALGEAAAVLAHEVRNPLAVLRSASTLVERDDPRTRRDAAEMIREEVARLELLVRDLLQLARPLEPRPSPSSVIALARAAVERARGLDVERRVDVDVAESLWICVDPALIELAVGNLVRNAIDSSRVNGLVRLSVDERESALVIAVDDDGNGVDASDVSRIFEPFHTTRAAGTGLGLSIAKRIVEAHGGVIDVRRSTLGGARFEVVLPRDVKCTRTGEVSS